MKLEEDLCFIADLLTELCILQGRTLHLVCIYCALHKQHKAKQSHNEPGCLHTKHVELFFFLSHLTVVCLAVQKQHYLSTCTILQL